MTLGRIVAAALATAGSFYAAAAAVAWLLTFVPRPGRSPGRGVMADRAFAWSATSALLWTVSAVVRGVWTLDQAHVLLLLAGSSSVIFLAGLNSVRAFTLGSSFSWLALLGFGLVSLAAGLWTLLA